jgi:hypothetical protein
MVDSGPQPVPPEGAGSTGPATGRRRRRIILVLTGVLVVAGAAVSVAIALGGGGPGETTSAAPSLAVGSPVGLSAAADAMPLNVTLSWAPPAGGSPVVGYRVYREGVQIAAVPSSATMYVDTGVAPLRTYTYEVLTRGGGTLESDRVSVQVEVPAPPLQAARLRGRFEVKVKVRSQYGYEKLTGFTTHWEFDPKCDVGACDVIWKDLVNPKFKATLERNGARYAGSDLGKFGSCSGVRGNSTFEVRFRVKQARYEVGEWRAVKLVGTLEESHDAQSGCGGGGASFSITATLLS